MLALESVTEELKSLPAAEFEEAAKFIHSLKESAKIRKKAILEKTFGCLNEAEADEWEAAVKECRRIDNEGW